MAFRGLAELPYRTQLIETSEINTSTLNPADYIDSVSGIVTSTSKLSDVAKVLTATMKSDKGIKRIGSNKVDRSTGEVSETKEVQFDVSYTPFLKGDILLHKYRARIGRIGFADFDGFADHHFVTIRPFDIKNYYLLMCLRTSVVLSQLPFRETTRPSVSPKDLQELLIPRLGKRENDLNNFVNEIFSLRKRSRRVIQGLLESFNTAVSGAIPNTGEFLINSSLLEMSTLDPAYYAIKKIAHLFANSIELKDVVDVIQPHSLADGNKFAALTAKDYNLRGVYPLTLAGVEKLWESNMAKPNDVLLNKLQAGKHIPARAVIVPSELQYLDYYGLTVQKIGNIQRVPVYEEVFILRPKKNASISPFYLALFLTSDLFQQLFFYLATGSTGRQRLKKALLEAVKIPIFDENIMFGFTEALSISSEILSNTFKTLTLLTMTLENVIFGKAPSDAFTDVINHEQVILEKLNLSINKAYTSAEKLSKIQYTNSVI